MNKITDGYPEINRPVIMYESMESGISREGRTTLAYKKTGRALVVTLCVDKDFKFWAHANGTNVFGEETFDFFRPARLDVDKNAYWIYCPE